MLTASQDFHLATVQANPNEHILFAFHQDLTGFGDPPSILNTVMFWTGADVNARVPVRITETANPNTELSIGQAPSTTLSCEIFNERGLLTHYLTQEAYDTDCTVYLGVETASNPIPHDMGDANCIAYIDATTAHSLRVTGHNTAPYLRLNGAEMPIAYQQGNEITWPVKAIIVDQSASETGPVIVAIGDNLKYCAIQWELGDTWGDIAGETWGGLASSHYTWGGLLGSGQGNGFSTSYWNYYYKFPQIAASGNGYSRHGNTIYVTSPDGIETKIEYLPVGVFRMNAPTQIDEYSCAFTAYDKMTLFDVDIADWLENDVTYPIDLDVLLSELCEHIGVGLHSTTAMLNYDMSIAGPPEMRSGATGRTLLQHIAEAAGCNAVMTRDGELDMRWMHTTPDYVLNPSPDYLAFTAVYDTGIASYTVAQIDGVSIENPTDNGTEVVSVGSDTNPYRLTTNPLLINETTATVVSRITPIKNRLAAFPAFRPVSVRCLCDWSIEAGDCLNFWYQPAGTDTMSSILMPIYRNTITYVGVAEVVRENSGSATRPPASYAYGNMRQAMAAEKAATKAMVVNEERRATNTYLTKTGNAYRTLSIPFGTVDSTSTSKLFTATVSGITELRDGVCAYVRNGVVTSAKNFTLNINGLGAKPVYQTMADASRVTTAFNTAYTMLFVYNSSRVSGGCWDMFYGYNTNTTYTNMSLGNGCGTCATSTAAATVVLDNFALKLGGIVAIKFTNALPANATLAINSTAAKAVYYRGAANTAGDIQAGDIATFIYDGTNYVLIANDRWGKESGGGGVSYTTCSTAASTAAKTASATGVSQASGTLLAVLFNNGNTAETPTFALNGATALPIYSCYTNTNIASTAITTGMTAMLMCNGSAWILMNPKQGSFLANYTPSNAGQSLR